MRTWIENKFESLRESFWFLPSIFAVLAVALAFGMIHLDEIVDVDRRGWLYWLATTGAAARTMLGLLAGTLVTVATLIFSVTMLVLSQTSSQYGPRLVRSLLRSNVSQFSVSTFLGATLYSLFVLRVVRDSDAPATFVPHLAVAMALLLSCLSAITLIFFIDHVASSIRAETIVTTVYHELLHAIERLYPEPVVDFQVETRLCETPERHPNSARAILAKHTGYLQAIMLPELMEKMRSCDGYLKLVRRPGHFVATGESLGTFWSAHEIDQETLDELPTRFIIGTIRTPYQDVECAISEIVEVAVRSLSPGINDPFTAILCIDYLGAALRRLAERPWPNSWIADREGVRRIESAATNFSGLQKEAFAHIRHHGRDSTAVLIRLLEAIGRILRSAQRADDRRALRSQAESVLLAARNHLEDPGDLADVERVYRELMEPPNT